MKWILMRMGGDEVLEKHSALAAPSPDLGTTQEIILQSSSTDLSPSYVHITCGTDGETTNLCYSIYAMFLPPEGTSGSQDSVYGRTGISDVYRSIGQGELANEDRSRYF